MGYQNLESTLARLRRSAYATAFFWCRGCFNCVSKWSWT